MLASILIRKVCKVFDIVFLTVLTNGMRLNPNGFSVYVVPTGMEEAPKAALDIHCLQRGGGVALTHTIN